MTDLRTAAQQALDYWEQVAWGDAVMADKMDALRAALAQQAEPVEPVAWVGDPSTQDYASTVPDPQIEDRLARHGIPMPEGNPK